MLFSCRAAVEVELGFKVETLLDRVFGVNCSPLLCMKRWLGWWNRRLHSFKIGKRRSVNSLHGVSNNHRSHFRREVIGAIVPSAEKPLPANFTFLPATLWLEDSGISASEKHGRPVVS